MRNVKNPMQETPNKTESTKETIEKMKRSLIELKTEDYFHDADRKDKISDKNQNNDYLNERDKLLHIRLIKGLDHKKRP